MEQGSPQIRTTLDRRLLRVMGYFAGTLDYALVCQTVPEVELERLVLDGMRFPPEETFLLPSEIERLRGGGQRLCG